MSSVLLVVNAGSSSLKFAVFGVDTRLSRLGGGQVERIGRGPRLRAVRPGETTRLLPLPADAGQAEAFDAMLRWFDAEFGDRTLAIVGHRVVHGGMAYTAPVRVDDAVLARLETLDPIVPLHQPYNLAAIRHLRERAPQVPQLACFDTAFHAQWPDVARRFALPRALHDEGVRRYGFHGLSYDYLAGEAHRLEPKARRVVIAHLGSGASVCAVDAGRSIDCSLGFTALDGLPMGTRCGPLDPGVAFHLLRAGAATPAAVEKMLYQDSGLLGVSGISADMRELLASPAAEAREAVDLFAYHCTRQVAAMTAALGGIDALVFSGGIGENAAAVRERVCAPLGFLGVALDAAANARNVERIGTGRVPVLVVPTDEEIVIARACRDALASA